MNTNLTTTLRNELTTNTDLSVKFLDIFVDECIDCENIQEVINKIENGEFIPSTGCVSALIYCSDTNKIFAEYYDDILDMADEYQTETGCQLSLDTNSLVWFAWENVVNSWYSELQDIMYEEC